MPVCLFNAYPEFCPVADLLFRANTVYPCAPDGFPVNKSKDLYPFVIIFQSFKELLFFFCCMPVLLRISQEIICLFVSTYKSPKQSFGVCRAGAPQKAALTVFQY